MTAITPLDESLQTLRWRSLFTIELDIIAVQKTGAAEVVGVVGGGLFEGPRVSGRVLAGGSDWQRLMPDGSVRLDCRLVLETTAGNLIAMTYQGVRAGSPEVLARLAKGADVGANEYYLRVNPLFTTQSPEHDWLNRVVAVGTGQRLANGPTYNIFEIL